MRSLREHEELLSFVDDIRGELAPVAGTKVLHGVDRSGRDEQDVAGVERHRWPAVEAILERAFDHIHDLFARVAVPGEHHAGGDVDARLDELASGDAQIVPLEIGALDSRLRAVSAGLDLSVDLNGACVRNGSGGLGARERSQRRAHGHSESTDPKEATRALSGSVSVDGERSHTGLRVKEVCASHEGGDVRWTQSDSSEAIRQRARTLAGGVRRRHWTMVS